MGHFEEKPGVWVNSAYSGDAANYLANNPDVAKDPYFSARPMEHWERFGKNENRSWGGGGGGDGGDGGGGDWGGGGGMLPSAPQQRSEPRPAPVAPTMPTLPALNMSDGASTSYQLNKMQSIDSIPMQQAEIQAQERGVASGAIHSSQQGGAAQRAVQNAMTPLAQSEASLVGSEDIANWSAEVKRLTDVYEKQYAGYLAELGIQSNERIGMMQANTSLSTALMGNITSLMNNPEIEFGEEVKNKLTSVFNGALMNNNTILDMGFSYA